MTKYESSSDDRPDVAEFLRKLAKLLRDAAEDIEDQLDALAGVERDPVPVTVSPQQNRGFTVEIPGARKNKKKGVLFRDSLEPVLVLIEEREGRAKTTEIFEVLKKQTSHRFSDYDRKLQDRDIPRWWNVCQYAAAYLRQIGQISSDSPRGQWELTEKGRTEARRFIEQYKG